MQKIYISFVTCFLGLFVKIQSEGKVKVGKVSGGTKLTSCIKLYRETVLDKFTGCEVMFTAGKNAA